MWNKNNLFTGWINVPLSEKGVQESLEAGGKISPFPIDVIFTSSMVRSQMTALIAMAVHAEKRVPIIQDFLPKKKGETFKNWNHIYDPKVEKASIPVYVAWQLNERMYGSLQGMNKAELQRQYSQDQIQAWRRHYTAAPPLGESLQKTGERVLSYFKKKIFPYLKRGKNVFLCAHGNSIRCVVMFLENLSPEEVEKLEIGLALPLVYTFNHGEWHKDDI